MEGEVRFLWSISFTFAFVLPKRVSCGGINRDLNGNDIKGTFEDTEKDCQRECQNTKGCKFYTYVIPVAKKKCNYSKNMVTCTVPNCNIDYLQIDKKRWGRCWSKTSDSGDRPDFERGLAYGPAYCNDTIGTFFLTHRDKT